MEYSFENELIICRHCFSKIGINRSATMHFIYDYKLIKATPVFLEE